MTRTQLAAVTLAATSVVAGLISPIVGWLGITTATPMAMVMASTSVMAILILWFVVRPRTVPELTH